MPIENADYFVHIVQFPVEANCAGMTMLNEDGTYSVYINARMSRQRQKHAMQHELNHILNDDIYSSKPLQDIEEEL